MKYAGFSFGWSLAAGLLVAAIMLYGFVRLAAAQGATQFMPFVGRASLTLPPETLGWNHLSTATGDLPSPDAGPEQVAALVGQAQDVQENLGQRRGSRAVRERTNDGIEPIAQPQTSEKNGGEEGFPEAVKSLKGRQRHDDFGLRPGVFVTADGIVQGQAGLILAREPELGLLPIGVRLQRPRRARRQDLEQETELVAERLTRRPAENVRVATDELGEGPTVERGGGGRMGAQPIFGDRAAAWLLAEDGRDGIRGAPGVVHDRAMELLHEDPSSGDGGMVGVRRASILPS